MSDKSGLFHGRRNARRRLKSAEEVEAACAAWNREAPVGTEVFYRDDFGVETRTCTRSEAWSLSGHTAVVMVKGRAGAVALERVRKVAA